MSRLDLARRILRLPQELHVVVVVGLFVSLGANLLVAAYTFGEAQCLMLCLAFAQLGAAGKYVPIAQMASQLWQNAYGRGGIPPSEAVKQLTDFRISEGDLIKVANSFIIAASLFLIAMLLLLAAVALALANKPTS